MTTLTTAIRAIDPGVAQNRLATTAKDPTKACIIASLDREKDQTRYQVSKNKQPANDRNSQVITKHVTVETEQPEIARHNHQDDCQTKDEEPGIFVILKQFLHLLIISFRCLHQGQNFIQLSCTLPQPGQVSRRTIWQSGHINQPDSTFSEQPGHSPDKGTSGGIGLSISVQI